MSHLSVFCISTGEQNLFSGVARLNSHGSQVGEAMDYPGLGMIPTPDSAVLLVLLAWGVYNRGERGEGSKSRRCML